MTPQEIKDKLLFRIKLYDGFPNTISQDLRETLDYIEKLESNTLTDERVNSQLAAAGIYAPVTSTLVNEHEDGYTVRDGRRLCVCLFRITNPRRPAQWVVYNFEQADNGSYRFLGFTDIA